MPTLSLLVAPEVVDGTTSVDNVANVFGDFTIMPRNLDPPEA